MTDLLFPLRALESVEELLAHLRALERRMDALLLRAARLEGAMRWRAPSAEAYLASADELRRMLTRAAAGIEDAAAAAAATRARLIATGGVWTG